MAHCRYVAKATDCESAQDGAVTVGAGDAAEKMLATMRRHQVWRLPVIDGQEMIGMMALADVARALSDPPVGAFTEALSVDREMRGGIAMALDPKVHPGRKVWRPCSHCSHKDGLYLLDSDANLVHVQCPQCHTCWWIDTGNGVGRRSKDADDPQWPARPA